MKYIVELLGTFFLVLTILLAIHLAPGYAAFVVGGILVGLVYLGGPISKAHYNPAVTLAFWMRGKITPKVLFGYVGVQLLGGWMATKIAVYLFPILQKPFIIRNTGLISFTDGLWQEFLGTFALVLVIMIVATWSRTEGNKYYGVAIGGTVAVFAYFFGATSFGAFNPVVALSFGWAEMTPWENMWIYMFAQFSAGIIACRFFELSPGVD